MKLFGVLLDGVIGEVDIFVGQIPHIVLFRAQPQIALIEHPNFWRRVLFNQYPLPDIELLAFNKERILDILLSDILHVLIEGKIENVVDFGKAFYSSSPG